MRRLARSSFPGLVLLSLVGCVSSGTGPVTRVPAETALQLTDRGGTTHDLDAALARGEHVALVFWQTWCSSCRRESPAVLAALRAHGDAIRFVGVIPGRDDTVDEAEVDATIAEWGYRAFPQVRDRDLSLTHALGVRGTPTIVVLGAGRGVRYHAHRPPNDWATLRGATLAGEPAEQADREPADAVDCDDGVCPLPAAE